METFGFCYAIQTMPRKDTSTGKPLKKDIFASRLVEQFCVHSFYKFNM